METCTHKHVAGKHLRRTVMAVIGLTLLLIPLALSSHTASAGTATVSVDGALSPKVITVQVGTTVTWQFNDADKHRMRSVSGPVAFDSGGLAPGGSWSFTFNSVGTVNYRDDEHKTIDLLAGSVVVVNSVPSTTTIVAPTTVPGTPTTVALPKTVDVRIANRAFGTPSLSIAVGDTVQWTNADKEAHTVTERNLAFDSGSFGTGATWKRTFTTAGTFNYICDIHPSMVGVVTVSQPTTGGTLPPPPPPPTVPPSPVTTQPPAGGGNGGGTGVGTAPNSVTIADFSFSPAVLTVAQGTTVTWTNRGQARHTVAANDGSFNSLDIRSTQTWTHTFSTPGTYTYICDLHPQMTATVAVTGANGTPPPPPASTTTTPTGGGTGGTGGGTTPAGAGSVTMVDFGFSPAVLTVAQGTTVVWTNKGLARHTVAADDGTFHSPDVRGGQTWSRTFSTPGTYTYLCDIHPQMTGTIAVTGANGTPPPPAPPTTTPSPVTAQGDVRIADFSFSPSTITITAGQSLTFVNTGAARHSATARDGSFDTGLLPRGQAATRSFPTAGTYLYFCTLHSNMTGTILVKGADGSAPPPPKEVVTAVAKAGDVQMIDFDFSPKELTVAAGASVGFTNGGVAPHTATSKDGTWDTGIVRSGTTTRLTFDTPGTYTYYCTIHPQMVAKLLVTAADGSAPPPEAAAAAAPVTPSKVDVKVLADTFEPADARVAVGGTITWTVDSLSPHIIESDGDAFKSGLLQRGKSWSFTFDKPGTFQYHDGLTGDMVGSVTVVADPSTITKGAAADGKTASVNIVDLDFDPREVTVAPGAEVTWTNTGQAPHTVTGSDGSWGSDLLQNGDTFSYTFQTTGRYEYICNLHPNMKGTVVVTDAAGVAPAPLDPQPAAALVDPSVAGRGGTPMLLLVLGGVAVGLGAFFVGRRSTHAIAIRS